MSAILDFVQAKTGAAFKRHGSQHGGEWVGPCPFCREGTDRFHVWPLHPKRSAGGYWCRSCGASGDAIALAMHIDGLSYRRACAAMGVDAKNYDGYAKPVLRKKSDERFEPKLWPDPCEKWIRHAGKFADACHAELMGNRTALDRLYDSRGITATTAQQYKIGLNPQSFYRHREAWGLPEALNQKQKPKKLWIPRGLVVPYIVAGRVIRIKVRRPDADLKSGYDKKYFFVPGSSAALMIIGKIGAACCIVETEIDAILIVQDAGDLCGAIALGSVDRKPDRPSFDRLRSTLRILVSLDYDDAGPRPSQWWCDNYPSAQRWPAAAGKDPGEMFRQVDIRAWVLAGLPPVWRFGRSGLQSIKNGGAALDAGPDAAGKETGGVVPAGAAAGGGADNPGPIEELYNLMKASPLIIINEPERLGIEKRSAAWPRNDEQRRADRRISELVFLTQESRDYVTSHPDSVVWWRNFWTPNVSARRDNEAATK